MKLKKEDYIELETFITNKARDLELALFNCLLLNEDKEFVFHCLSIYQNKDGGFGHGLEPDNTCPSSSAIATEMALNLLKKVGYNKNNIDKYQKQMIMKATKYVFEIAQKSGNYLFPVSQDTNNYPHACWWDYNENLVKLFTNNPSASLYALTLHFFLKEHKYYKLALSKLKLAIDEYFTLENVDKNMINVYQNVYEILLSEKITYKSDELYNKIMKDIKKSISPKEKWACNDYPTLPTDVIKNSMYLTNDLKEIYEESLDFLITHRTKQGYWDINWNWNNQYIDDFEVARIKWLGILAVNNLYLLKCFNKIET